MARAAPTVAEVFRRYGEAFRTQAPPTVLTDIITVSDFGLVNLHDEDHLR